MLPMCSDVLLPMCQCCVLCAVLVLDTREGGGNAIFHILQSCIGRPEITAVDLLRNKIVTDITLLPQ
jgi:hypothetical protein